MTDDEPFNPWEPSERYKEVNGYHVVPQQLGLAGLNLVDTSYRVKWIAEDVEGTRLSDEDLGILGQEADNAPGAYNDALDEYIAYFHVMQEALKAAGELLCDVAKYYAAKDDSYYEQISKITTH